MSMLANDTQYEEAVIDAVREQEDGYELTRDDGWTIFCPKVDTLPAPQVGETVRLYGRGIGYTVRGIAIHGRVYRYMTESEEQARHEQWCRDLNDRRERDFRDHEGETDRRIAALPTLFRERLEKFQRDWGHKFRRDYESYELFCCEQAVVIADALKTEEAITAFHALDGADQKQLVSGLDDGHSGNTFGMACVLARAYIAHPEFIATLHGALVPLVGCDAYGCLHPTAMGSPQSVDAVDPHAQHRER